MPRLGQNRLGRLAGCVTGDIDSDAFDYRRHEDLENFFARFEDAPAWDDEGSRHTRALRFLTACNRSPLGESRLPVAIESVLREMLNVGEFEDEAKRDTALAVVKAALDSYRVAIETDFDGEVQIVSTASSKHQSLIDAELHTAFGSVLNESDLQTARVHYGNARRMVREGDYPNAAKEAVCSVEACLSTLTGEKDLKKALRLATKAGLPKPLDGVIEKLYAWRGNEPGVAHGSDELPDVERADAEFALNMAAAINLYLRERLLREESPDDSDSGGLILFC
jgi:hypothetical protein